MLLKLVSGQFSDTPKPPMLGAKGVIFVSMKKIFIFSYMKTIFCLVFMHGICMEKLLEGLFGAQFLNGHNIEMV